MTLTSRRTFIAGAGALSMTAACGNGIDSRGPETIDARVDATLNYMYANFPGTQDLRRKSTGMLVMPLVTEAGFGIGGSYGRGALRINDATVDYYSAAQASIGLQIGAQQYAHVLFFMTDGALMDFRRSQGYAAGADIEYALQNEGERVVEGCWCRRAAIAQRRSCCSVQLCQWKWRRAPPLLWW